MSKSKQTTLTQFITMQANKNSQSPENPNHNIKPSIDHKNQISNGQHDKKPPPKSRSNHQKQEESNSANQIKQSENESDSSKVIVEQKENEQKFLKKGVEKKKINTDFYLNKIKSEPNGDKIDVIHLKWWGDYEKLERHHGFIQWLFPNSFQSRFNPYAFALSPDQVSDFRTNKNIASRYVISYMMMLQFYGLKLTSKITGQISYCRFPKQTNLDRSKVEASKKRRFYEDRFHKTFLTSFHNHMRITRILSSLVICGFGRYARQLSMFLEKEINNNGGLRQLKKHGIYQREWKQFKSYKEEQEQVNIWLKEISKDNPKL